jgi:hypothetical protein
MNNKKRLMSNKSGLWTASRNGYEHGK